MISCVDISHTLVVKVPTHYHIVWIVNKINQSTAHSVVYLILEIFISRTFYKPNKIYTTQNITFHIIIKCPSRFLSNQVVNQKKLTLFFHFCRSNALVFFFCCMLAFGRPFLFLYFFSMEVFVYFFFIYDNDGDGQPQP